MDRVSCPFFLDLACGSCFTSDFYEIMRPIPVSVLAIYLVPEHKSTAVHAISKDWVHISSNTESDGNAASWTFSVPPSSLINTPISFQPHNKLNAITTEDSSYKTVLKNTDYSASRC